MPATIQTVVKERRISRSSRRRFTLFAGIRGPCIIPGGPAVTAAGPPSIEGKPKVDPALNPAEICR